MSYPPQQPAYPPYPGAPPPSTGYPPSSGVGGIGFESLMIGQPNNRGYPPQPTNPPGPYPTGPMPNNYGGAIPAAIPPFGGPPPSGVMPMPVHMHFGQAANVAQAAVAFQAPMRQMPAPMPQSGYGAPSYNSQHSGPPPSTGMPRLPVAPPSHAPQSHGPPPRAQPSHVPAPRPPSSSRPPSTGPSTAQRQAAQHSNRGTVKPFPKFDAQVDAEAIRKAVGGFGTNVKDIITILSTRTNSQRLKITLEYKSQFGRDLNTDLRSALGGSLENLLIAMMQAPAEYDASELRRAMKGLGTKESVLIEILCSRTNAEIAAVKRAYNKKYSRDLEKDVYSETSGHFRKFLISLLQANRDESSNVDYSKAVADAQSLYTAGEKRWGTDESRFNVIFALRSFPQLRAIFNEYAKVCKYDIEKSVEREMSGDLKNSMITLVQCVRNTPGYFAMKLYKSMKGLGTDDGTLIRIVVTRCEVDMLLIKQEFTNMYQKTLADFIKGDTSGNYRKTLLGLIGEAEK